MEINPIKGTKLKVVTSLMDVDLKGYAQQYHIVREKNARLV